MKIRSIQKRFPTIRMTNIGVQSINPSNNILSTDTHYYDGKLNNSLEAQTVISTNISKLDKTSVFEEIKQYLLENKGPSIPAYPIALASLNMLERDIDQPGNYDSSNNFQADTILYLLFNKIKGSKDPKDLIKIFVEVLAEIVTGGSCPQGRSTRLYQLYI